MEQVDIDCLYIGSIQVIYIDVHHQVLCVHSFEKGSKSRWRKIAFEKDGSDGSGLQAPPTWGQKGLRKAVKGRRSALLAKLKPTKHNSSLPFPLTRCSAGALIRTSPPTLREVRDWGGTEQHWLNS